MSDFLVEEKVWFSASANKWTSSDLSLKQAEDQSPERSQCWSTAQWTKTQLPSFPPHHAVYQFSFLRS